MILYITGLCLAVYASPASDRTLARTCEYYAKPARYDVTWCAGEVITYRDKKRGLVASCEVSLEQ